MATTDLKLDEPGTLVKPGPIGRTVRLVFGVLLLWYVAELWSVRDALFSTRGGITSTIWNGVVPGLFLIRLRRQYRLLTFVEEMAGDH